MTHIHRILVATDFSETSRAALHKAKELADAFHAELQVLHVINDPYDFAGQIPRYLPEADAFRQTLKDVANAELDQTLTPEEVAHYRATLSLCIGRPATEIVRFAKDHQVSLIVIGTHGRGAVGHMLLGSVAENVVRHAHCPVLTVRNLPTKDASATTVPVPAFDPGLV